MSEKMRRALEALIVRLDEIHGDPTYLGVWTLYQIHCGPYRGPTYGDALAVARAALADAPEAPAAASGLLRAADAAVSEGGE